MGTRVQSTTGVGTTAGAVATLTLTAPTEGNLLVLLVAGRGEGGDLASEHALPAGTWQHDLTIDIGSADGPWVHVWSRVAGASEGTDFSVDPATGCKISAAIFEVSGVDNTTPIVSSDAENTTTTTTGSVSSGGSGFAVVGVSLSGNNSITFDSDGFTAEATNLDTTSSGGLRTRTSYRYREVSGTVTLESTGTNPGTQWAAGLVHYPDAAAAGTTVSPATVAATVAVPGPTAMGSATVSPATVAGVAAVPTPSPLAASLVTPAAVPALVAVPTPTAIGETAVNPATAAAVATVPTPTPTAPATVTPDAVAIVAAVPTPSAVIAVTTTPDAVATLVAIPGPTPTAPATVTPATVAGVATVPTPTAVVEVTVQPDTVVLVVDAPTPSPLAASTVTPATVAAVVAVPGPAALGQATVTPGAVSIVVTVPTPTAVGETAVSPLTVAAITSVPTPTILGILLEIAAKQYGRFYRYTNRLALVPLGRGASKGYALGEGFDRVSSVFVYDQDDGAADHETAMAAVAAAWAAHSGSSTEDLLAAIDEALQAAGFRAPGGGDLA